MKSSFPVLAFALVLLAVNGASAQTSYPMLMSLKPTAARIGETSEHELTSRYSMFGAYRVLVIGEGVSGEIVTPMELKDGKRPDLTKIKIRFTVAPDAEPGVRDFRVATPQGVSTLGQLVIGRDPVIAESGRNETPAEAQEVALPVTFCGTIEKTEDVDYFKFQVESGAALSFHVRSMRLQDRIHDLQTHADPIISLKNATGATLAAADNTFAADPLLTYRFEQAGEYLLEIRDARYQGNVFWEYSIEVSDRPFVTNVFPMAVVPGQPNRLEVIGRLLPTERDVTLNVPSDAPLGPHWVQLPLAAASSNPVPVFLSDLPHVVESEIENNTVATAQQITAPCGISGRIEADADIDCYRFAARKGEQFAFEVLARRQQSELDSVLRLLDAGEKQLVEDDDLRLGKRMHQDSWIEGWTAPADGEYIIEIRDLHLRGGEEFVYFLKLTRPQPCFELYLDTDKTQLTPGTCGVVFVRAERKNGFAGEILLSIEGLPEGVTAHCGRIPAGKGLDGCIILEAAADAKMDAANVVVTGHAVHSAGDGESLDLTAVAKPQQEIYMPGGGRNHWPVELHTVSVGEPSDIRSVALSTYEITLAPGQSQRIDVTIERTSGFEQNVTLDVLFQHLNSIFANTLPEGVAIDTKNSKTLLTGSQTQGYITLKAADNAPPAERQQVAVMAHVAINFVMKATYSSPPLIVTVGNP